MSDRPKFEGDKLVALLEKFWDILVLLLEGQGNDPKAVVAALPLIEELRVLGEAAIGAPIEAHPDIAHYTEIFRAAVAADPSLSQKLLQTIVLAMSPATPATAPTSSHAGAMAGGFEALRILTEAAGEEPDPEN